MISLILLKEISNTSNKAIAKKCKKWIKKNNGILHIETIGTNLYNVSLAISTETRWYSYKIPYVKSKKIGIILACQYIAEQKDLMERNKSA